MLIVVGLGNPGAKFTASRHNVGFRFVDQLARKNEIRLNDRRAKAVMGRGQIYGQEVVLAKPVIGSIGEGSDKHRAMAGIF